MREYAASRKNVHIAGPQTPRPAGSRRSAVRRRRGRGVRRIFAVLVLFALTATAAWLLRGRQAQALPAALLEPDRFVVAVDPGHGGGDSGAVGVGLDECEMTWRTAEYLMELLEADSRFAPFMTTDGSEYEDVSLRAANARAGGAQLLISIHGNSGASPEYAGFECYPVPPGRDGDAQSLDFARRIARGFGEAGAELRGQDGVRYLYFDADDGRFIVESSDTTVHTEQSFTLLEECGCPAVLAEQCFVTSPADTAAFGDEDGCRTAAGIYYDAICSWYEANAAGGESDSRL